MPNRPQPQFAFIALLALAALGGITRAADCVLGDVAFKSLTNKQATALGKVGGRCDRAQPASGPSFGSPGYIVIGGKPLKFVDLAADGPARYDGKPIEIYGYLSSFSEVDPNKVSTYRFDFTLFEGDLLQNLNIMNRTDPEIDIVIATRHIQFEPMTSTQQAMRAKAFRNLTMAAGGKALVKVTGTVGAYVNTGALYITSEGLDVVARRLESE